MTTTSTSILVPLPYDEAVTRAMQIVSRIKVIGRDFVRQRFYLGEVVDRIQPKYGDSTIRRLQEEIGVHENTLRECARFWRSFEGSPRALEAWMNEMEDVRWIDAQRRIRSLSDPRVVGVENYVGSLARRIEGVGKDIAELQEVLSRADVEEELRESALATAHAAVEEVLSIPHEMMDTTTPRSPAYLKWVRSQPCCVSGSVESVEAHHLEQGGTGMKGSDFSCIPLDSTLHMKLENRGHVWFENTYEVNLRYELMRHLHRFLTGKDIHIGYEA
jgi:hypothetical protein